MSPLAAFLVLAVITMNVCGSFHVDTGALLFRGKRDSPIDDEAPSPPSVNCASKDFETVARCCKKPVGDLFSKGVVKACDKSKSDDNLQTFLKEYKLHRLQDFNQSNAIVLNGNVTLTYFGPASCLTDCIFRKQKLVFPNESINYDAVSSVFSSAVPSQWKSIIVEAVTNCSNIVQGSTVTTITVPSDPPVTCLLQPALLLQCVRMNLLINCPASLKSTYKNCPRDVKHVETCDPFVHG